MKTILSLVVILVITALGLGIAYASGLGDHRVSGLSIMMVCAIIAYGMNWLVFIPSSLAQTEKFYDLTGSLTYLSVISAAAILGGPLDLRSGITVTLVAIWAVRLGGYLFLRISADGHDARFDAIKTNPVRFLVAWTLQGLWVTLTAACALMIISSETRVGPEPFLFIGLAVWVFGFAMEAISDAQKSAFRKNPDNKGKLITTGLWAWSRHPNYFGEIVLWLGVAIMAVPLLQGLQWLVLISPVFVYVLLTRVSGVPLLEKRSDKKWGEDEDYLRYRDNTPVLIPRPPRKIS